ncbi:MAG: hypothetical protein ACRC1F_03075 [Metamycoplasmataceae bacterium]
MKTQTSKAIKTITSKPTRQYTCSRRRNKEDKKIWVVLEEGRKFYRIFKNRSMAISYFKKLKTIYAEMLVQDLDDNVFSSIVYTKLETKKRGLAQALQDFQGGVVENSDELFDEDSYLADIDKKGNDINLSVDKERINTTANDFSFVDNLFPKPKPLISPVNITIRGNGEANHVKEKLISSECEISIYQSDRNLNLYILGRAGYDKHKKDSIYDPLEVTSEEQDNLLRK